MSFEMLLLKLNGLLGAEGHGLGRGGRAQKPWRLEPLGLF